MACAFICCAVSPIIALAVSSSPNVKGRDSRTRWTAVTARAAGRWAGPLPAPAALQVGRSAQAGARPGPRGLASAKHAAAHCAQRRGTGCPPAPPGRPSQRDIGPGQARGRAGAGLAVSVSPLRIVKRAESPSQPAGSALRPLWIRHKGLRPDTWRAAAHLVKTHIISQAGSLKSAGGTAVLQGLFAT